jgi:hypothetical protein
MPAPIAVPTPGKKAVPMAAPVAAPPNLDASDIAISETNPAPIFAKEGSYTSSNKDKSILDSSVSKTSESSKDKSILDSFFEVSSSSKERSMDIFSSSYLMV